MRTGPEASGPACEGQRTRMRGEQKDPSDLDLLIDFEEPIGLIRYVGLQNYLSDKIGEKVDLVTKSGLKQRVSGHILKEVIYV